MCYVLFIIDGDNICNLSHYFFHTENISILFSFHNDHTHIIGPVGHNPQDLLGVCDRACFFKPEEALSSGVNEAQAL